MSTKDCTDFIESQNIAGLSKGLKWKRTSKKKDEQKNEIRTFKSHLGDEVTVKEDTSGNFSIDAVVLAQSSPGLEKWFENKIKILDLIESAMPAIFRHNELQYIKKYNVDLSQLDDRVKSAMDYFLENANDLKEEYSGNELLTSLIYEVIGDIYEMQKDKNLEGKVHKPIEIQVSSENLEAKIGYLPMDTKKNYQVITGSLFGDWENSVDFALYWDFEFKMPRIHIPEEAFNKYNRKFKCAYGSEEEVSIDGNIQLTEEDKEEIDAILKKGNDIHKAAKTLESLQNYLLKAVN